MWNKFQSYKHIIIAGISGLLLFLMIILAVATVIVLFSKGINISVSQRGVENMLAHWHPYESLLSALFWVTTLYVASYQLERYIKEYSRQGDIDATKALASIRQMLDSCEDNVKIHSELEDNSYVYPENAPKELAKLFKYLGILELAGIMVKKKVIPIKEFNNQFKYRLENIQGCDSLWKYLNANEKIYWDDLHWIIKESNSDK